MHYIKTSTVNTKSVRPNCTVERFLWSESLLYKTLTSILVQNPYFEMSLIGQSNNGNLIVQN